VKVPSVAYTSIIGMVVPPGTNYDGRHSGNELRIL
jgi:hypothetical protein